MAESTFNLSSLSIEPGGYSPPFAPTRGEYATTVDHDVAEVKVAAAGSGATFINGVEGGATAVPLREGNNWIPVDVVVNGERKTVTTAKVVRRHVTPTWNQVAADRPFKIRDSAGDLVFQDHMWIFGGYTPQVVSDVWRSQDGIHWEQMPDFPCDSGVNIPIRFVFNDQMWMSSNTGRFFRSRDGKSWELVAEAMPWGRRLTSGSAVFRGRMWVMGGRAGARWCNDVWSSADGENWTCEIENAAWSKRQLHDNVVVFDDRLWLIGGGIQNYHPFRAYQDVWSSEDGRDWEEATDQAPWPARVWSSCVTYANRMWHFGGFRAEPTWQNFNDVWYSGDGVTWHALESSRIWSPRHEVCPYVFRDKLWVAAGNAWPLMNDVWNLGIRGMTFVTQPVLEDFPQTLYTYRARADFHASRGPVSYRMTAGPAWLKMDAKTGVLRGTSPGAGEFSVAIEARDEQGSERATQRFSIHIR